ncbi:hypothetical protein PVAP13_8KG013102 [Panicum virgatum]|uniref:Uncharacterized protein n=1 Tax=Panicum virgatum TaxID=38727 RepID=A0A8T0PLI2_PANVG|nr:hypothetical protein PVAP13_8KG013102 [Panicum virgatum]
MDLCRNQKCALEMPRDLALEWHIGLWFRDNHGYADNQQVDPHGEKLLKTHLFFHDTSWTEVPRSSVRTKCIGDLEDGPRLPSSYRRTRSAVRATGISCRRGCSFPEPPSPPLEAEHDSAGKEWSSTTTKGRRKWRISSSSALPSRPVHLFAGYVAVTGVEPSTEEMGEG